MKKRLTIITASLFVIAVLAGCVSTTTVERSIDADEVTSVQIYDLRSCSHDNSFLETEEPVYTIEEEKTEDFLSDLGGITFTETKLLVPASVDPGFTFDDWTVRINYSDESYLVFSCDRYVEHYDQSGEVIGSDHGSCEQEQWDDLIEKYVPEDILNGQT